MRYCLPLAVIPKFYSYIGGPAEIEFDVSYSIKMSSSSSYFFINSCQMQPCSGNTQ